MVSVKSLIGAGAAALALNCGIRRRSRRPTAPNAVSVSAACRGHGAERLVSARRRRSRHPELLGISILSQRVGVPASWVVNQTGHPGHIHPRLRHRLRVQQLAALRCDRRISHRGDVQGARQLRSAHLYGLGGHRHLLRQLQRQFLRGRVHGQRLSRSRHLVVPHPYVGGGVGTAYDRISGVQDIGPLPPGTVGFGYTYRRFRRTGISPGTSRPASPTMSPTISRSTSTGAI